MLKFVVLDPFEVCTQDLIGVKDPLDNDFDAFLLESQERRERDAKYRLSNSE